MNRKKWLCLDCKIDTGKITEHYFINTNLWMRLVGTNKGMLCIGCLEKRLGRKLIPYDFTNCYINKPKYNGMSERLLNRISE